MILLQNDDTGNSVFTLPPTDLILHFHFMRSIFNTKMLCSLLTNIQVEIIERD